MPISIRGSKVPTLKDPKLPKFDPMLNFKNHVKDPKHKVNSRNNVL